MPVQPSAITKDVTCIGEDVEVGDGDGEDVEVGDGDGEDVEVGDGDGEDVEVGDGDGEGVPEDNLLAMSM